MTNDIEDEDLDLDIENINYAYFEQIVTTKIQHYYLSADITEPLNYVKMIHSIRVAPPGDTIIIHLNTIGGDLATGIQIINAMRYTNAHVVCSLEGEAFSLGSLIFLAADEFLVHDNSRIMIHHYSGVVIGKGSDQVSQLESDITWFNALATDIYIPFISSEELKTILRGEDMWLHTPDIRKRLAKMVKDDKKKQKAG